VYALTAHRSIELLIQQALEFNPAVVCIADERLYQPLRDALNDLPIKVMAGENAISEIVTMPAVDIVVAAMELALMMGGINQTEYDSVMGNMDASKKLVSDSSKFEKIEKKRTECENYKTAPVFVRNLVYSELLRMPEFQLTAPVKEHLKKKRGLSEEKIAEEGFFCYHKAFRVSDLVERLKKRNPSFRPEMLAGVPGFYFKYSPEDKKKGWWRFVEPPKYETLGLPVSNGHGEIMGLQMRSLRAGSKYYWLSSNNINDKSEGFAYGTTPGSPIHVEYPEKITNSTCIITEGRFKAIALAEATGSITLSLQGVSTCARVPESVKEVLRSRVAKERLDEKMKDGGALSFYIAFDADMWYNRQVFHNLRKLTNALKESFPSARVLVLLWDSKYGKGFDDFRNQRPNDYQKDLHFVSANNLVNLYDSTMELMEHRYQGRRIEEIEKEPETKKTFYSEFQTEAWNRIKKKTRELCW
jgi:hypothetical protein